MVNEKTLDISWPAILKVAIAFLSFYLIFLIRNILVLIIFALIISILFNPAINFVQKRKVPRVVAVILIYIGFFGIFGFLLYWILPPFISETKQFSQLFPQYFEKLAPPLKAMGVESFSNFETFIQGLQDWLIKASSGIFSAISAIFGGIMSTVIIFIIAVFLSFEQRSVEKIIELFVPKKHETYVLNLWEKSQTRVTGWFGARLLGSVFVGVAIFIACKILVIDYAASFAILAGITNIVPIIGPIIAGIIISLFTALDSWSKSLFVLIAFILIQQIEGNILTPILVKKFIGLSPVLVLIALLIGGKLWGVLGALLIIPLAGVVFEFLKDYLKKRKEEKIAEP